MAAEDRQCCGDPFTVAPRLGRRSRTSASRLELVERRDQARSRGKAVLGSPFGPRGRPLHALQPLRTVFTPLFIRFGGSAEQANKPNKQCLFEHQNGASRPRERRDEFSRFQAWLKPCLGSLEQGTGLQCLCGPSGGHAFSGRTDANTDERRTQPVGHASDTRSRTLILARDARRVLGHTCVSARAMTSGCTTWSG